MDQHNEVQADAAQIYSDTEADKSYKSPFKRRPPLSFSPHRQYALAVVSPLQKPDSCETVLADDRSPRASPPVRTNDRRYTSYNISPGRTALTLFEPFSFDESDAARKVWRERRLQEMRKEQEQRWRSTFKAHPIRRYKPLIRLCGQPQTRSQQPK